MLRVDIIRLPKDEVKKRSSSKPRLMPLPKPPKSWGWKKSGRRRIDLGMHGECNLYSYTTFMAFRIDGNVGLNVYSKICSDNVLWIALEIFKIRIHVCFMIKL